jgi:glycosyltransferase involved in cell wall biosynthesis
MRILFVNWATVPVFAYGGTERVIWDLAYELHKLGHEITFLTPPGSSCDFGSVLSFDADQDLLPQIPAGYDITHFQFQPKFDLDRDFGRPYLMTEHGNYNKNPTRPLNCNFISRDHARRHQSEQYVLNGLNWESYGPVDLDSSRKNFHFLGKAEWRAKNVKGAIEVAKQAGVDIEILGGERFNFRRGFRLTFTRRAHFHGMVGGARKFAALNASQGLILPVRWHEPFGLAVIESLYFGCPVFSTTYGALPELVGSEFGFLSDSCAELAQAVRSLSFDRRKLHDYARQTYNSQRMAQGYLEKYQTILSGKTLHDKPPVWPRLSKKMLPWKN